MGDETRSMAEGSGSRKADTMLSVMNESHNLGVIVIDIFVVLDLE